MENKNKFRTPKMSDIKKNIKLIIDALQFYPVKRIVDKLNSALKTNSRARLENILVDVEDDLFQMVNRATLDWVLKNKDVPIY
jgi:ABC-type iron transport system FetAB ATPase subunit